MYTLKPLAVLLANTALASTYTGFYSLDPHTDGCTIAATCCGTAEACIGTEFCATATFTTPIATTVTTCIPTPTCLGVYGKNGFLLLSLCQDVSDVSGLGRGLYVWRHDRELLLGLLRCYEVSPD